MLVALAAVILAFAPPPEAESAPAPEQAASEQAASDQVDPVAQPAAEAEAKPDPREVYAAVTRIVEPTALLEADYRHYSDADEGNSGFAMARARLGLRVRPTDWMLAVATVEFIGAGGPYLLDGYARFDATDWLEVTVGYSKAPLFASFRHEGITAVPMPVRSAVVNQLRVRRDVGAEVRFVPRRAPVEAIVRLGNGSTELRANDNETPTGYAALDLVLGREWSGAKETRANELLGLRVGGAALVDDRSAHESIAAATPLGYVYAQPVVATGLRVIATGHVIGLLGPVRVIAEGGLVQEGREDDDDGDPATAPVVLEPVRTWALTGELTWTIRGGWRGLGEGPGVASVLDGPWDGGGLELTARADRFWLNYGAADLARTGGTTGSLALKWYPTRFLALAAYAEVTAFGEAPVETPDRLWGWTGLLRASFFWPPS